MKIALAAIITLSSCTPAIAGDYQAGYSHQRTCLRSEYREEYIPGTEGDPGYVRSWKETIEVPCEYPSSASTPPSTYRRHVTVYEDVCLLYTSPSPRDS